LFARATDHGCTPKRVPQSNQQFSGRMRKLGQEVEPRPAHVAGDLDQTRAGFKVGAGLEQVDHFGAQIDRIASRRVARRDAGGGSVQAVLGLARWSYRHDEAEFQNNFERNCSDATESRQRHWLTTAGRSDKISKVLIYQRFVG